MSNKRGFISLTSVLIISSVLMVISVGLLVRAVDDARINITSQHSYRALALADTCADIAIMKLKKILHYAGNEVIILESGSCTINTISGTGNTNRAVESFADVAGHVRRVRVIVSQISPTTTISLWEEVPAF